MKTAMADVDSTVDRQLLYFDLASDIARATTTESLKRVCTLATRALKFDHYLFGGYYPIIESVVMSSTYPAEWLQRYQDRNYVAVDPVVRHCWSESQPVEWDKITYSDGKLGEQEKLVMSEAREFGLRFGISVPVHGAGAESCILSLVTTEQRNGIRQHDEAGLHILVHAMHEATKRIISRTAAGNSNYFETLSPREVECLSWTAKGKTSWAIARILEVSENTVVFHLRNAIKKLEVTNRSHAVAKAIALSKITPF